MVETIEQAKPLIYSLIPAVMKSIGAVAKDNRNAQQGYQFRGIDDMYAAVHRPFHEHGIFCIPRVLERTVSERQTQKGGTLFYTTLKVSHTFYASDGSNVEAITVGEAMDSGDKSSNKAMSAAMKYALIEVFCIPTWEEDNDADKTTHEVASTNTKGRVAPAAAKAAGKPMSAEKFEEFETTLGEAFEQGGFDIQSRDRVVTATVKSKKLKEFQDISEADARAMLQAIKEKKVEHFKTTPNKAA